MYFRVTLIQVLLTILTQPPDPLCNPFNTDTNSLNPKPILRYFTKLGGSLVGIWGSSASVSGLDLASGVYFTVARAAAVNFLIFETQDFYKT